MTRINSNLEPVKLKDQHLAAEYRELPMVIASLKRSLKTKTKREVLNSIPKKFTLNKGHVLFFYDKLAFLEKRYYRLIEELEKRNYNLDKDRKLNFEGIPPEFFNDWESTYTDDDIVKRRIEEKIRMKPDWYKYYGK